MTTEKITKARADYEKVEAIRLANPDLPTSKLIEKAGVGLSSYYRGAREVLTGNQQGKLKAKRAGRPQASKPSYQRISVAAPAPAPMPAPKAAVMKPMNDGRLVFMYGLPDQISAVLAGGVL